MEMNVQAAMNRIFEEEDSRSLGGAFICATCPPKGEFDVEGQGESFLVCPLCGSGLYLFTNGGGCSKARCWNCDTVVDCSTVYGAY